MSAEFPNTPDTPKAGSRRAVRIDLFAHLAIIAYWATAVLNDYERIDLPGLLSFLLEEPLVQIPLMFVGLIFPVLIVIAVVEDHALSGARRFAHIAVALSLALFQFWVMLPLVL